MRRLPLYAEPPQAVIAETPALSVDSDCTRCDLRQPKTRSVCMPAEGDPGGVLIIGESPGKVEDQVGRPLSGATGRLVRQIALKYWKGPVAYDQAVRCAPGAREVKSKHIEACRPYGADIIAAVAPTRIVCMGGAAIEAVLGRRPNALSVRRGHAWYFGSAPVPIFFTVSPASVGVNRFLRQDFEEDLKWALTCPLPKPRFNGYTVLVEDRASARAAERELLKHEWFTYDIETSGQMHDADFRIEAITLLGADSKHAWTWTRKVLFDRKSAARLILCRVLESGRGVSTQNGKYDDRGVFLDLGAVVENIYSDTRLEHKLLYPSTQARLEILAEHVGMGGHKDECHEKLAFICKELRRLANPPSAFTKTGKARKIKPPAFKVAQSVLDKIREGAEPMAYAYRYLDEVTLYQYNARDVWTTRAYTKKLKKKTSQPQYRYARRMWDTLVKDASKAVRQIEHWGMGVDRAALYNLVAFCDANLVQIRQRLDAHGKDFNPDSPRQVGDLLFKKLKIKSTKQTDSGAPSTDKEVLEQLAAKHPVARDIREWRKYSKLKGNYGLGILSFIRGDGRVHPHLLLDGAEGGRTSCTDPNLQNLPRAKGNPEGKMVRDCFVAQDGWSLLELDQSQIELRVAGDLSGDEEMIKDFERGIDIHAENARACCTAVWGISLSDWDKMTKEEQDPYRSQIKAVTFGKLYGKGLGTMAREWGVKYEVVAAIDKKIWGRYKKLARWCNEQIALARKLGYVTTWWDGDVGVIRHIPMIGDADDGRRKHGENQAVNTPVQGTAAHYTVASLWPLVRWIEEDAVPAKLVITVHDSIMFEVKNSAIDEVAWQARHVMTSWPTKNGTPLKVDMKVGQSWGTMRDYKIA